MDNLDALKILQQWKEAIIVLDTNYSIEFLNEKAAHLLDLLKKNPEGKKCYAHFYKRRKPCPICPLNNPEKSSTMGGDWYQCMGKWIQVGSNFIHDGTTSRNVLTLSEAIFEDKVKFNRQEEYLRSIFRAAPIGIGVVVNRVFSFVNTRICELSGYSVTELLGQSARMLYTTDEEFERVGDIKYKEISLAGTGSVETQWCCKDGTIKDILLSSTPLDPSNPLKGVTFTALDISDRKKFEKKFLQSEFKYKNLIETAADAIVIVDAESGHIIEVNKKTLELLGYNYGDLIGEPLFVLHPPDQEAIIARDFKRVSGGEGIITQTEVLHVSGKRIPVEINATNFTDTDGKKLIMGFFRDFSARIEWQKALEDSEERYRKLVESSPNIILVVQQHSILFANSMALSATGYKSMEALLKKSAFDLIHPDDRSIFKLRIDREEKGLKNESTELRLAIEDGTNILVESISLPIVYNDKPASLIICTDIAERRRAEYAAIEIENTIRDIQMGLASKMGEKFFETVVIKMAHILKANYAFVGELDRDKKGSIKTLSFYKDGRIEKNFQYSLKDTPCNKVMKEGICVYNQGVTKLYPKSSMLLEMGVDGYIGIPLHDSKGSGVGIMVALFKGPILNPELAKTILEIFSARTGAEIERLRTERILGKAHESFRTIAENMPDILLRVNTRFECTYVNPNVFEYTSIRPEDFIGRKLSEVDLDPDFSRNRELDFKKVLQTREPWQTVISVNTDKGHRILEWRMLPEYDDKGRVESVLNMIRDLTETKRKETQLNQLFNLSVDLIGIVNMKGPFVKVNPAWETILGYSQQELKDIPFFDLIHPEDLVNTYQIIADRLEMNELVYNFENRYRCKDGSYKWLSWVTQPFGKEDLMFAIGRDITEQKLMVNELILAKEKAEESDTLKSAFLANMSHEIRTPMNAIIGFSSLLNRDDITTDKRKYYSNIIQSRSEDLLSIINDILDISKIESNQIQITKAEFSINDILFELYEDLKQKLESFPSKDIEFKIGKRADPTFDRILSDRLRIKQVLTNLIDNAIKFTDKGQIVFGCVYQSNTIQFYVSDTGIGIAREMQYQIFERFRQAEESMTRRYGGNGLGLSISKALVEMMGGEIWMDSIENTGTTFYFTIPDTFMERGKQIMEKQKVGEGIDLKGKRVLIVEDEPISREYLGILLKQVGGEVHYALTGEEALNAYRENPDFDLILMDIHLPDMDGYKVTRSIRASNPDIPIIAQTAFAMSEDKLKSLNAGCTDYLSKPVMGDDLLEAIRKALKKV